MATQALIFRGHTLAQIADEFSRYNRAPRIVIQGEELRGQRIPIAIFDADDPESLIAFLANDETLVFERDRDTVAVHRRTVSIQ